MRPITFIYDDLGLLDDASEAVRTQLRDLVPMTPATEFTDDPIVLDSMPSMDHADDFMDRVIAMATDLHVVFTLSALVGERTDLESALVEPLTLATLNLAGLRRFHAAFAGDYEWDSDENGLIVAWENGKDVVRLHVPDPREGTDFILIAKGSNGDFEWRSFHDLGVAL
ncbi:MAG: hypothetical protein RLZZ587_649 [Actinomycetota bacterium]